MENELLYRHAEARLDVVEAGQAWRSDDDGHLFRLVSEAELLILWQPQPDERSGLAVAGERGHGMKLHGKGSKKGSTRTGKPKRHPTCGVAAVESFVGDAGRPKLDTFLE